MTDSIYAPRSDKKFGEKDSVTHCKPTISQIAGELDFDLVVHLHFSDFGDLVIWRSEFLPVLIPPFLRPIRSIVIQRFGEKFRGHKNLKK